MEIFNLKAENSLIRRKINFLYWLSQICNQGHDGNFLGQENQVLGAYYFDLDCFLSS